MSSTLALVSKYLDADKIKKIVIELSQDLEDDEKLDNFCDLVNQVDQETKELVSLNGIKFVNKLIETNHDKLDFQKLVKLAEKLPHVYDTFIENVVVILKKFMKQNINKFIVQIRPIFNQDKFLNDVEGESYELDYIIYLLQFLEYVFSKINLSLDASSIDEILSYLMTFDIEEIHSLTLKIFRWRIIPVTKKTMNSKFFWNIIFSLVNTGNRSHQVNAYILWLRYLNNNNSNFENDTFYQTKILDNSYFQILQQGLISDSHEHRKLCLSILKLSILKISIDINNEIFTWEMSKKEQYLKEWGRFITVFEIIAIDTSLHQMEAASGDLIALISPKSLINSSWGFRLLSTGFRAGTDAVRKFSLYLLLSIPSSSLCLIDNALSILEDIFLPNLMVASYLVVNDDKCEFGEKLTEFISNLIKGASNKDNAKKIIYSIFNVMINSKTAFDPCKSYVLFGVYFGLENDILEFGYHDDLLISLFECKSEGILYFTSIQTTLLNTLLKFKFNNTGFLKVIDKFIKFNGANLINENIDIIKQYLINNKAQFDTVEDKSINAVGTYFQGIISNFEFFDDIELFCHLLGSGLDLSLLKSDKFDNWFHSNLVKLLSSDLDSDLYEKLSTSNSINEQVDLSNLWKNIQHDVALDNEGLLITSVAKYTFFNKIFENLSKDQVSKIINIKEFLNFKNLIFINHKTNISPTFYKVKEAILGEYYKSLEILTKLQLIEEFSPFIQEIPSNLSNHQSNISITSLFTIIINSSDIDRESIVAMTEISLDIWHSLESARFKLYQKDIQVALIKFILHQKVLIIAAENEELSSRLITFCNSVIDNSYGRRCLLPALTKQLSTFQIQGNDFFEKSYWINEILVNAYTMYQLRSNSFKLEPIIGRLFDAYFGNKSEPIYLKVYETLEVSAQVNLMAIFNSIKTNNFANSLLHYIIDNEKKFKLFKVKRVNDGYEQWIRIRLFTIITSIFDKIDDEIINDILPTFINLLETDPSPLVRVYIEWVISLQLIKSTEYRDSIFKDLKELISNKNSKPTLICAYERMLALSIQQLPSEEIKKLLGNLLTIAIPGATANKALIRHFSNSLICSIYVRFRQLINKDLLDICKDIYDSAMLNPIAEYKNGDALLWDIRKDINLVSLSGGMLMRVSNHEVDLVTSEEFDQYLDQQQVNFLNHPIGENLKELWIKSRNISTKREILPSIINSVPEQSPLQTKSGAWSTVMDVEESSKDRINEIKRSDLIVVSSLVDKPPNLGGICRLCDVLGAGLLTVDDINVKKHPEFKSVAVTADHWMPMVEVKIDNIIEYLRQKKQEGYTLIGLEQTDKSVQLNGDLKFPKKSLILLGKEREGVPGELLAELDFCVEIKQVGIIRSMNIQTATAVIVHAYASQHC